MNSVSVRVYMYNVHVCTCTLYTEVLYTLAKLAICYPSLWLVVPGLNSHCFLYNLLLRSALVSSIFGKWLLSVLSHLLQDEILLDWRWFHKGEMLQVALELSQVRDLTQQRLCQIATQLRVCV